VSALLEIRDLAIRIPVEGEPRTVVHDVSLSIGREEAVALVGESGSGKSMTARAVMRLLPEGAQTSGEILFEGRSIGAMSPAELREFRRARAGMIFQDPRAHINPVRTVGDFLTEALIASGSKRRAEATTEVTRLLDEVGVSNAPRRLRQYPHELSGGLLQRVMIAAVLAMEPDLILADEPTTALDVTTQSDVMAMLDELRRERGMALLLITHNLELASAVCDRTAVMYAGCLVEERASSLLHKDPLHPYSAALSASRPDVEQRLERLTAIKGRPLSAFEAPDGCPFAPRCPYAEDACRAERPALRDFRDGRVACRRAEELDLRAAFKETVADGA
jgi:oligopeptide/dipeptide ABC transporter ATP-binding protein